MEEQGTGGGRGDAVGRQFPLELLAAFQNTVHGFA